MGPPGIGNEDEEEEPDTEEGEAEQEPVQEPPVRAAHLGQDVLPEFYRGVTRGGRFAVDETDIRIGYIRGRRVHWRLIVPTGASDMVMTYDAYMMRWRLVPRRAVAESAAAVPGVRNHRQRHRHTENDTAMHIRG